MGKYSKFLEHTQVHFRQVQKNLQSSDILSNELWESVKKGLLSADVGPQVSQLIEEILQQLTETGNIHSGEQTYYALRQELIHLLERPSQSHFSKLSPLTVIMVMGHNGSGVTTTSTKLAFYLTRTGQTVLLISQDLARTTGKDHLKAQLEQNGVFAKWPDSDADLVQIVAILLQPSFLQGINSVLIDASVCLSADNKELEVLHSVIEKVWEVLPNANFELLGVFDATRGQKEVVQFRQIATYTRLTGVIFSKLEISAKGGCIFAIADDLEVPIKFLGVGKEIEHLIPLDPADFVAALFE